MREDRGRLHTSMHPTVCLPVSNVIILLCMPGIFLPCPPQSPFLRLRKLHYLPTLPCSLSAGGKIPYLSEYLNLAIATVAGGAFTDLVLIAGKPGGKWSFLPSFLDDTLRHLISPRVGQQG